MSEAHEIIFKLPRGSYTTSIEAATPELRARFSPETNLTLVTFRLEEGAHVRLHRYGVPYRNAHDPEMEAWVNNTQPIADGIYLADLARQREFIVAATLPTDFCPTELDERTMPSPFMYPYGRKHDWIKGDLWAVIKETRSSEKYIPAFSYENDNDHVASQAHAVAQDVLWIDDDVSKIALVTHRAYVVAMDDKRPDNPSPSPRFYVIVSLEGHFHERFSRAWRRVTKDTDFTIEFHGGEKAKPVKWYVPIYINSHKRY